MAVPAVRPSIPPLTSLRFFAAAVVVAFHYDPNKFSLLPGFFQSWLETGYEAVTFFFVLSGFILSYVYAEADLSRRANLRAFFAARFGRLAPAYYLALLVSLPFYLLEGLEEGDLPLSARHRASALCFRHVETPLRRRIRRWGTARRAREAGPPP